MKDAIKEMMIRLADGQWGCSQCEFSSTRASSVGVHIEAKHLLTTGFICPVCSKHCPTRNSLNIHKFRYHRGNKPWKSSSFSVNALDDLAEIEKAIDEQMGRLETGHWCCYSCDYVNSVKTTVRAHIEAKHVRSSGFQCLTCNRVCPTRHALKMHKLRNKH